MILLITFLITCIFQLLAGNGIITLTKINLKPWLHVSVCLLLGVAIFSFIPFTLQLLQVRLHQQTLFIVLSGVSLLPNMPDNSLTNLRDKLLGCSIRVRFYELPFILFILALLLISVWRCYYLPPTPRDLVSGPEVIAKYALREKTMVNSVFTVDLSTTNNQYKPAFITSLQIIYKYLGFTFGQVWLSAIYISFLVFLYQVLIEKLHRLVAAFLLCAFMMIPDFYGYSFMALFDFPNALYFCLSLFFLIRYLDIQQTGDLALSAIFGAISTYIRSETLFFNFLLLLLLVYGLYRSKMNFKKWMVLTGLFFIPSLLIYWLSVPFYIHHYLPVSYSVSESINKQITNLNPLWTRFVAMNKELLFSAFGITLYGYFLYLFLAALLTEIIWKRTLSRIGIYWLAGTSIIYFGLPVLGFLLPLIDLDNTTKRGLFKLFPLMLLYLGQNQWLMSISQRMKRLERR